MNTAPDLKCMELLDKCPVCGHLRYRKLPLPKIAIGRKCFSRVLEQLILVRCLNCGHIFQKNRPSHKLLDEFYKTSSEYSPFGQTKDAVGVVADRLRLEFINQISANGSLMDFGGGGGRFAKTALDSGRKSTVVELSPIGRDQCKSIGVTSYPNLESIPSAEKFDIISMIHVLEHVGYPVNTIRHLSSRMDSAGGIYIEVPNLKSLRARVFPLIDKHCPNDCWFRAFPSHLHGFSKKSLSVAIKKAGLKPVRWMTYGGGFEFGDSNNCSAEDSVETSGSCLNSVSDTSRLSLNQRLRNYIKHLLFKSLLLGENLCVLCVKDK